MFENLDVFRMAHAMAAHAGARQSVIARNMAHADTPGYAAQDIPPFNAGKGPGVGGFQLRATRPSHLNLPDRAGSFAMIDRPGATADPNGNSVNLETEMVHAVNTKRQHDRALAIYRSSLEVLRTAIGQR
ncbi:FlgB family protein [Roseovarius salis]|uniref:FlgB family protein n=1 Tax=Roseovarius salis TaxID=3376063 RepID=UPI0037CC6DC2